MDDLESSSITLKDSNNGTSDEALATISIRKLPQSHPSTQQYFVPQLHLQMSASDKSNINRNKSLPHSIYLDYAGNTKIHLLQHWSLMCCLSSPSNQSCRSNNNPLVDYSKSILLTNIQNIETIELKAKHKKRPYAKLHVGKKLWLGSDSCATWSGIERRRIKF